MAASMCAHLRKRSHRQTRPLFSALLLFLLASFAIRQYQRLRCVSVITGFTAPPPSLFGHQTFPTDYSAPRRGHSAQTTNHQTSTNEAIARRRRYHPSHDGHHRPGSVQLGGHTDQRLELQSTDPGAPPSQRSRLLLVSFAIPDGLPPVVRRSQRAYAARHGYDFREVRNYIGRAERGHVPEAVSLQKLLACTLAAGHAFVLVLDADVVVAPWAPPIDVVGRALGRRVGIVDENQPSADAGFRVKRWRLAQMSRARGIAPRRRPMDYTALGYYAAVGFPGKAPGILNTGVLLLQPKVHGALLEELYYKHLDRQIKSSFRFHYEQALLGRELMDRDMHALLPHAWNRIWVFYSFAGKVGERAYGKAEVFRRSYFMHFCWMKGELRNFERWLVEKNISFSPQPYAKDVLP